MCVRECVCMCVRVSVCVFTHIKGLFLWDSVCVCACVRVCVCVSVCDIVYVCVCVSRWFVCVCVCCSRVTNLEHKCKMVVRGGLCVRVFACVESVCVCAYVWKVCVCVCVETVCVRACACVGFWFCKKFSGQSSVTPGLNEQLKFP